jgi:hypothetical protein
MFCVFLPPYILKMRTQDIKIGESYRHRTSGDYAYAKALEIIKPKPKSKQITEIDKQIKCVVVKCEWSQNKDDVFGFIKYFRPCDLVKIK